jgi:hypothetical protein
LLIQQYTRIRINGSFKNINQSFRIRKEQNRKSDEEWWYEFASFVWMKNEMEWTEIIHLVIFSFGKSSASRTAK